MIMKLLFVIIYKYKLIFIIIIMDFIFDNNDKNNNDMEYDNDCQLLLYSIQFKIVLNIKTLEAYN